jgi:signal transduction histidine kinase
MLEAVADGVVSDPDTVARYLRQCQSEVSRMSALIDDLFELTRLDAGGLALRFEATSLSDLISDTLQGFAARAEARGVKLSGAVAPEVDPVWLAPEKMSRVLRNLLANAVRHTPAGGEIRLTAAAQGGSVVVTVADNGEGIAPEDLPRVFERFYRGEKSRSREGYADEAGGTGLGLAIVRELVEAHGGRIEARSAAGQGTTMVLTLPRQPKQETP